MTREEKEQTGKYVLQMARLLEDGCYQQEMLLKAVHIIDEALQQESFEDAVSRQAVCNIVDAIRDCISVEGYWAILERLKKLPSVTPQKIGHWIDTGSGQECSECREIQYGYDNFRYFCANCGARMIEPQESEVDND